MNYLKIALVALIAIVMITIIGLGYYFLLNRYENPAQSDVEQSK